ncbi:MAG: hypothetical protein ABUL77_04795 [Bacteroidota bacterium]
MKTYLTVAFFLLVLGLNACGDKDASTSTGAVTFWKDVAPIYNQKCVRCHQQGGIGPFALDNYADAKTHAATELARVTAGTMPPYFMVHDGSCGSFHDDDALTEKEKNTIAAWVNGAKAEGPPTTLSLPVRPTLANAVDVTTPSFSPVAQGGQLAMFDEYRCFLIDPPTSANGFLTGYDVTPGDATVVHHVIGFIVDPAQEADGQGGMTNATVMAALDGQSPDRLGWPCFGGAGEGVNATAVPVTWAPGQGVVNYPEGMGVPIRGTDKFVIQMHYNLADLGSAGRTDATTLHLRVAPTVERELAFVIADPFLDSLGNPTPDTLPPQRVMTSYVWTLTGRDIGVSAGQVDLVGVMPHMHGRGVSQELRLGPAGGLACAARLENWNFHWQEFYFYKTAPKISPTTQIELTCDYNTINDTQPVLPGWGTRNEMCLAVMMIALPPR